jgi:hypothetical protein
VSENAITTFPPSDFEISNIQTTEFSGAHLPFFVDFASFICNIEYDEFDSNWWINNLSDISMKRRDLDATDRILWDFIFGNLMHLHLVYICRSDQNMTNVVAVRLKVILVPQYRFSPQMESFVFIFWQNMTYYSKKHPFSIACQLYFKEIFAKGKTDRAISDRDSSLSGRSTDKRPVNKLGWSRYLRPVTVRIHCLWDEGDVDLRHLQSPSSPCAAGPLWLH